MLSNWVHFLVITRQNLKGMSGGDYETRFFSFVECVSVFWFSMQFEILNDWTVLGNESGNAVEETYFGIRF